MRSTTAHAAKFLTTVLLAGWLVGPHASAPGGDIPPAARAFPLRFEAREAGTLVADTLEGSIAVSGNALTLSDRSGVETLRLTLRGDAGAVFERGEPSQGPTRVVSDLTTSQDVTTYRSLRARGIAPGVDAIVSGEGGRIEMRFEIAVDAAPATISLASSVLAQLDAAGRVRTPSWTLGAPLVSRAGDPAASAPSALLTTAGAGELAIGLPGGDGAGPIEVRFPIWEATSDLRALDPARGAPKLTLDADGNAYVTARAPSRSREGRDLGDILVARLDRSGRDFEWVTYLAGEGNDEPRAIAADAQGRVSVASRGAAGSFVAHLDAASGALLATTSLDADDLRAIESDGAGGLWVAGRTATGEGLLARIDASGSLARFGIPGAPIEAIAVAADGSSIVAARGTAVDLLSTDGSVARSVDLRELGVGRVADLAFARDGRVVSAGNGGGDVVVATIEPGGDRGTAISRLTGEGPDEASALTIDHSGHLLVAGRAGGDLGLSVTPRRAQRGGAEGFAAAYNADGRSVLYGAYFGGSADDTASSIVVDGNGRVWVAGVTASSDTREDEGTFSLGAGGVGFVVVLDDLPAPARPSVICPTTKNFDGGGATDSWTDPLNWNNDTVPTAGQDVCIDGAFAVTVSGTANALGLRVQGGASLSVSSGTLTLAAASDIDGPFTISAGTVTGAGSISTTSTFNYDGGTLGGTGSLTANAGMTIGAAAFKTISRSVTVPGGQTVTYSGTGGMAINTPATFTNAGTWNHQTDADISGTGILANSGTFNRTNSAGLVTVSADFNNTGTVDVQTGILSLSGDGTDTGDYDSSGAILRFAGGARTMSAATAITGGDVDVTNGTYTFNGTYDVAGTTNVDFGTFTWTATSTITNIGSVLSISGGTMTFNSGDVIAPGTINQTAGTITGSDAITVPGLYTFDGGTMSGTGTTTANGGVTLGGASFRTVSRNFVIPAGQAATYIGTGGMAINTPATLTNAGTWEHQTDADLSGTGLIANSGTFNRVNSAGLVTVSANFNNTGTVDVQTGILSFSGNGTDTGDYDSTGAALRFAGGTRSMSAATAITGGDVEITNGTYTFNGTYDVAGITTMTFGSFTFTATSTITNIGNVLAISGGTFTFNSGNTLAPTTLLQTAGTMTGSDNINVSGLFTFDGGTHSGTGTTTASGGAEFGGASFRTLARVLIVPNGDTATYAGTGGMAINTPGVLTNNGIFEHQTDADISGTGVFNNTGTFNRTNSAGLVTYSCDFNNTGIVDVQTGEFRLTGDGVDTGDYDCAGAVLNFGGGTRTIGAASIMTGSEVRYTGGTVTVHGTYDIASRTFLSFGNVTFSNQSTITSIGSALDVDGGTMTVNSGEAVSPTTLTFTGGTITGSDALNISGLFTWEAGTLSGSGAATASGGIALTTGNGKTLARNLTNAAGNTATYSGTGGLGINAPAVLTNAVGATWDHQTDAQMTGTGSFNNLGTFNRTTSSDEVIIFVDFDNGGSVDVQTGSLHLNGGGTASGSYDATGTLLRLGSGTFTFTNTSSITGTDLDFRFCTATLNGSYNVTGTTLFSGGDATFAPPSTITSVGTTLDLQSGDAVFNSGDTITVGTLLMSGGNLGGSDNVNVTGPLDWNSGQMSGSGTTTLQGGLTIDNFGVSLARPLVNATGSTAVTSGANAAIFFLQGGSITNQPGATWEVQNDNGYSDPGDVSFTNAGTFKRTTSAGPVFIDLPFTNTGTVDLLSGLLSAGNYVQNAGVTRLNGGDMATNSSPIRIFGGTLTGTGDVQGSVTIGTATPGSGTIAPGSPAGGIAATGTTTFAAGGGYDCEIGGLTAGSQHDLIGGAGSGPLAVGGTLNVSLINGFNPAIGNTFTIMQGTSRTGTFATTNLPPLGGGNVWTVTYTATTVVLNVGPPISADLSVTNVDAPDPVNAGGDVTYTITVASAGPDPATGVTLVDTLDGTTSFVSATPSQGTCVPAAGTVTCNLGNMASGAQATVTIVASTTSGSVPSITSSASVSATEADLNNANNTASATTTVNPVADLSITKSDTPDPVAAAGTITYTLDVSNAGPNDATGLTVTDNLPLGTAFANATGTGWACSNVGQIVTCTRPTLAVGVAPSITITATAPGSPGSITNNASVTSTSVDPTTPNTTSAQTSVTAVADLSISKGDAPDPVDAGATLTYTLNVSNAGPSTANTVSVTDTLPAGVSDVIAGGTGWTCTPAAGSVTCTRPALAVGAAPAITITVTAPVTGGTITNTASVSAAEFDPTTPNTVSVDTDVTAIADISVTKTDSPDPANTSSTLTYTVTVTNNGPSPATNVVVVDALPTGVTFGSADGTGWVCNEASLVVTCTRATPLPVGAAPPITIIVTTPATPGLISNGVSAGAAEEDPDPADNIAAAQTSVALITADLSIAKSDSADPVNAAAAFSYALAVANGGPDPATNVTVTDTLPAGVAYVNAAGTGWTCGNVGQVVTCTRPALAVGAAPAITIDVTAPAEGGVVGNTATVAAPEADNDPGDNTDTESTAITAVANLTIAKADSPDPVAASDDITYTISITNVGPSTATNLTMTDTLPVGTALVGTTATGWTCGNVGQVVTCTRPTQAVGAAPDITIVVTAPAAPGLITNTASVTAAENDPSTPNTATATTNVTGVADLSITKLDDPDPVNAGQNLTYTIDVANAGPSAASAVTVTDSLPPGAVVVSATGTGWNCTPSVGTVTCTRPTLAVGAAPPISIVITPPAAGGTISNTATVAANEFDPTTPNTATADTTVVPIADLSIAKTDSPDPVNTGSPLTYTLALTNLGPSPAASVTVTDILPATVTVAGPPTGTGWTCSETGGTVTCTRATLAVGAAPPITIPVTAPGATGFISNTASVSTTTADPVVGNNSDTEGTSVTTVTANLSITKAGTPPTVDTGANFTYTLTVANAGPDPATGVTVSDALPPGVTYVSFTGTGWACVHAAGVVTCTRPALAVGAAPPITLTVTAPLVGGQVVNTATVSASEADPDVDDNQSSFNTTVNTVADLSITKTDGPDPVLAGGALTYTITVTNLSTTTAVQVAAGDVLPVGVTFVSAGGTGWNCTETAGVVACTRPTLAPGPAPAITIVVTAPPSGVLTNTASLNSTSIDPVPGNNQATATTTVTPVADLSLVKSDSADPVNAGATFSYALAVTNAGPSTAASLSVSDPLPAGLTNVTASGTGWTCSIASGTVTCTRATLAVQVAPPITVTARAPLSGVTLTNTATVTSTTQDPDAPDRSDTETTDVVPVADLSITKATTTPTVGVGAALTWSLSIRNHGPSAATNVVVTDFLPAGVTLVSATGAGWTCVGPVPVTCTRATLASGAVSAITLNATAPLIPGSVTNTATIEADETDPVTTNDTGQSTIDAVVGGACASLEDLLAMIDDADVDPALQRSLEAPVRAAIAALEAGQSGVASSKLSLFKAHCTSGAASGRVEPDDAQELIDCASSLTSGLVGGGNGAATAPAKKGGGKPATPARRR